RLSQELEADQARGAAADRTRRHSACAVSCGDDAKHAGCGRNADGGSQMSRTDVLERTDAKDRAMKLTPAQMDQKIDENFGFEAGDDVNGVLATLTQDAEHDIVGWPSGPTHGPEGARPFYEALFADLADGKVTCTKRLYGDNFLVDESVWS